MIKQLAGDLLPNASFDDLIATSFHRQTQANDEGGTDDEEFRLAAVMDRTATTWSALNGVSFNCVQCHSHPYDPIRHNEYYKFLAFFNTTRDADIAFDNALADDWPVLHVPTDKAQYAEADRLQKQIERCAMRWWRPAARRRPTRQQWKPLPIQQGSISEALAIRGAAGQACRPATSRSARKTDRARSSSCAQELARAKAQTPAGGYSHHTMAWPKRPARFR